MNNMSSTPTADCKRKYNINCIKEGGLKGLTYGRSTGKVYLGNKGSFHQ